MGAGGLMKRVPYSKPQFSFGNIKKAIPPHCFERSITRSFSYLIYDLSLVLLFYYIATTYFHLIPSPYHHIAWPIYWIVQGCVSFAVWVIAHECGHHAFSDYQWLDDTVGFILHSSLLVPYFSWKYSHRRHHSNTASLERDENYVPINKSQFQISWFSKYFNNPLGRVFILFVTLTLGWPMYLALNKSGRPYDRFACHFDPHSPIYNERERFHIYLSDAGVIAMTFLLYRVAMIKGLVWIIYIYGVPLMIVNAFLIVVTYLQHTHSSLPHYNSTEWDWLRGSLSTADRDYGVLNKVFHHITDTHVAHHLFSTMPHYHAVEATKAIKPILGDYYHFDGTPFYKALWREGKECLYVEPEESCSDKGVFWYKNKF